MIDSKGSLKLTEVFQSIPKFPKYPKVPMATKVLKATNVPMATKSKRQQKIQWQQKAQSALKGQIAQNVTLAVLASRPWQLINLDVSNLEYLFWFFPLLLLVESNNKINIQNSTRPNSWAADDIGIENI
jgi:hypothetical protein